MEKMQQQKISIRFYNDREVRAVWDESDSKWYYSVLDVIGAFNQQDDYEKNRNYWKYLKAKLKKEGSELVSATTQLKLKASDGKRYNTDVMDMESVRKLALSFPNTILITTNRRTNAMRHTYSTPSTSFCPLPGFGDPSVILRRSFGESSLANHSTNQ